LRVEEGFAVERVYGIKLLQRGNVVWIFEGEPLTLRDARSMFADCAITAGFAELPPIDFDAEALVEWDRRFVERHGEQVR
jgi:hypothetical protein